MIREDLYKCKGRPYIWIGVFIIMTILMQGQAKALDSNDTRRTLSCIKGVMVMVEEIQPNIKRYAAKSGLTKEALQKAIEARLSNSNIKTLNWNEWLTTQGRPFLYLNLNTHEYERYYYSYDIELELKQVVSLEANPEIKTLATTWSIKMTGAANIGKLNTIKENIMALVDRFITAYYTVNPKR